MPKRIASVKNRIAANGRALHRAVLRRDPADTEPSAAEQALREERDQLKQERQQRREQAAQPRPSAVERMVRTHHAQPKDRPRAKSEGPDGKDVKKPKARRSRAEKHAEKAAAIEAARKPKKQAK